MSVPAQVVRQVARVQEIQQQMLASETSPKPEETQGEPIEEPVTPEPTNVEPPATVSKEDFDRLEQSLRTLQGMHKADANRFRSELAARDAFIQELQTKLTEKAKKTEFTPVKYVTGEDEAEYGETLEMVRRAAREEAENAAGKREEEYLARIAQLEARLDQSVLPTVQRLEQSREQQIEDNFWTELTAKVPDWSIINTDPKFVDWLTQEDSVTGATKQQFLSQARASFNAPRVIRIFEEWKRTAAGGQTPAPKPAQANLERMVAPAASKGAGGKVEPEKRKWTDADIRTFYSEVQRGRYRGREAEQKAIETDLFLAKAEGRYSPT